MITTDGERLRAAQRVYRALPKDIKNSIRRYQRAEASPIWKEEVKANLNANSLSGKVFKTGNTVKTGLTMTLRAAGSSRKLSGTPLNSPAMMQAAEWGSKDRNSYTKYNRRSPKGNRHTVTRRASRQSPAYRKGGYVINPAAGKSIQRITSLSVQTVTRQIYESTERI